MSINPELDSLARLIQSERERLLSRWRQQVRALPSAQCLDEYDIEEVVAEHNLCAAASMISRRATASSCRASRSTS